MSIKKCNNKTVLTGDLVCAPIEEINEYSNDISIETWIIDQTLDYSKYGIDPV